MRPFFSFYGGKWRDTPRLYPAPTRETIVEPFAGSAGYAVRYPAHRVILYEIDPTIAGVWRYLIGVSASEVLALPDVLETETVDDLSVCAEAKALIGFWLNRAKSQPAKRPSAWMRSGVRPGSFWGDRVRQTIAAQVEQIRHWQIVEADYSEAQDIDATWFVDPPYLHAGRHYRYGSSGIDFAELSDWCRARQGQVIVCEQDGAEWLPFEHAAHTKTTRRGKRSAEVFWTKDEVPQ